MCWCIKQIGFIGETVCMCGKGSIKSNVSELGAHSSVDLAGVKMKKNVSKLQRL